MVQIQLRKKHNLIEALKPVMELLGETTLLIGRKIEHKIGNEQVPRDIAGMIE